MHKPLLIIVNGLPASGKTTLSKRLAQDLRLPLFSRDGIYETLFDALGSETPAPQTGSVLAAGQSLIVERFFGRPELRTAEFIDLQRRHDFEPFQIMCKADGASLVERYLARLASRHTGYGDREWLEANKERLMRGVLPPLELDGRLVEIDTTTSFDYASLLEAIRARLT